MRVCDNGRSNIESRRKWKIENWRLRCLTRWRAHTHELVQDGAWQTKTICELIPHCYLARSQWHPSVSVVEWTERQWTFVTKCNMLHRRSTMYTSMHSLIILFSTNFRTAVSHILFIHLESNHHWVVGTFTIYVWIGMLLPLPCNCP